MCLLCLLPTTHIIAHQVTRLHEQAKGLSLSTTAKKDIAKEVLTLIQLHSSAFLLQLLEEILVRTIPHGGTKTSAKYTVALRGRHFANLS